VGDHRPEPPGEGSGSCVLRRAPITRTHLGTCKEYLLANSSGLAQLCVDMISRVAVSPQDFPPSRDGTDLLLLVNDLYVFSARPLQGFPQGHISMSDPQRTWAGVAFTDSVKVQLYDPFSQGGQAYLGSTDIEVGFAGKKRTEVPYDQDELASAVIKVSCDHLFIVVIANRRRISKIKSLPQGKRS